MAYWPEASGCKAIGCFRYDRIFFAVPADIVHGRNGDRGIEAYVADAQGDVQFDFTLPVPVIDIGVGRYVEGLAF
jgi:hypothetical protein